MYVSDGPIEVWLSQSNMLVMGRYVREDESTSEIEVDALSLRGAQREVTGYLIGDGFKPAGRWTTEREDGGDVVEVSRRFVPTKEAADS